MAPELPPATTADALERPQSLYVNRAVETAVHAVASAEGISPQVYGMTPLVDRHEDASDDVDSDAVEQLRLEQWVDGGNITASDMWLPTVYPVIARHLARLHSVPVAALRLPATTELQLVRLLRVTSALCRDGMAVDSDLGRRCAAVFDGVDIDAEVAFVLDAAVRSGSPTVVVHADAQPGNWVGHVPGEVPGAKVVCRCAAGSGGAAAGSDVSPAAAAAGVAAAAGSSSGSGGGGGSSAAPCASLSLIDFEYSGPNYRGFEFGNMVCEMAIDYSHTAHPYYCFHASRYPDKAFRCAFFAEYTAAAGLPPADVDQLLLETDVFMLASHLLWALWSVPMAHSTMADVFGYLPYAETRLAEYIRQKPDVEARMAGLGK